MFDLAAVTYMAGEIIVSILALSVAFGVGGKSWAQARRFTRTLTLLDRRQSAAERALEEHNDDEVALRRKVSGHLVRELAALEIRVAEHEALICAVVTEDEARHLWFLSRGEEVSYESHQELQNELRSLLRRRLIRKRSQFRIRDLTGTFNLVSCFEVTDLGLALLRCRRGLEATDVKLNDSVAPPQRALAAVS